MRIPVKVGHLSGLKTAGCSGKSATLIAALDWSRV